MAINGIKAKQPNLEIQGTYGNPETGAAMVIKTQDGRTPSSHNISITNRVDHHRKGITSMNQSTAPGPEIGKVNYGPSFKDTKKGPSTKNAASGVGTGPKFK